MDSSPLLPDFHPRASIAFATMPSHRVRHTSSNSHRITRRTVTNIGSGSVGDDLSTLFHFSSASGIRLSAFLAEDGSNAAPIPTNGPTTRSRKRKHSETEQNSPDFETSSSASSTSPPGRATRKRSASSSKRGRKVSLKKPPPGSCVPGAAGTAAKVSSDDDEDDVGEKKPAAVDTCCICMCDVDPIDLAHINGCDHRFCFGCIEKWSERENSCPLCKQRFTKIDRVNKKKKKGSKNSKKVKQRDQRTDLVSGVAIEGLIASIRGNSGLPSFFFGAEIGRSPFLVGSGSSAAASARAYASRRGAEAVPARANLEMDSDEDDNFRNPFSFLRSIHGGRFFVPSLTVAHARYNNSSAIETGRSYASNINDSTAGNGAENPLEIEDDSDEEVEVVQVTRP